MGGKLVEMEWDGLGGDDRYGTLEEMKDLILYKTIKEIDENKIVLENGAVITIECSESDCCAGGEGSFEFSDWNKPIDAVITDFKIGEPIDVPDGDTTVRRNTITLYHNMNPIVLANAETDAGNGGYYYSVTSLVIGRIHFPFVDAYSK